MRVPCPICEGAKLHGPQPSPPPGDDEADERTSVQLTDLQWALIHAAVRQSGWGDAREAADEMAEQVRTAQRLRLEGGRQ